MRNLQAEYKTHAGIARKKYGKKTALKHTKQTTIKMRILKNMTVQIQ